MASSYIKVSGGENIYVASGTKSDTENTITYNASTNTLTLNGYEGGDISTNVANLKLACGPKATAQKVTGTNGTSETLAAASTIKIDQVCSTNTIVDTSTGTTTTTTKNPDTFDPIVTYLALAIFSIAALFTRKCYYAKRK